MTSRAWRVIALMVPAWAAACVPAPDAPTDHRSFEDVRRIVVALDDVRDEYHLAVNDRGAVVDPVKLRVLEATTHDAVLQSHRFPFNEHTILRAIDRAVRARVAPAEVARVAGTMRSHLLASRRLVLAPAAPPPRARVMELWRMQCAGCHGAEGAGDGPQGLYLEPGPKSFQDEEVMALLAPTRANSRLADGLRGTAMPSWGHISTEERWGLAFLVLTFRHGEEEVARGRALAARHHVVVSPTWLADRTDGQLAADLVARGLSGEESRDVVAFARAEAAFAPTAGPSAHVRAALAAALAAYRAQRYAEAQRWLADAHRDARAIAARVRVSDRHAAARIELCTHHLVVTAAGLPLLEIIEREMARCQLALDRGDPSVVASPALGAVALALERAGAAALALGLLAVLLRRRRTRARAVALPLALVLVLVIAVVVGVLELTRALPSAHLLAAVAALAIVIALGVLAGAWLAPGARSALGAVAAAVAGASLAGRVVWERALASGDAVGLLPLPRVETLGLHPSATALGAALAGALGLALAWRLTAPAPRERARGSG